MIVVSNTSPIINLAKVGYLDLLQKLYGQVVIPQAVYDEIVVDGAGQPGAKEVDNLDWIEVKHVANRILVASLQSDLDVGEAEAVALAVELNADVLLLDERMGRSIASRLGLNYVGILGMLIRAKREDFIPTVKLVLDDLMNEAGFWVDSELYEHILQTAGEQ